MTMIEELPRLPEEVLEPDQTFEWLADGLAGPGPDGAFAGVVEGPVWDGAADRLLFSDIAQSRRYGWSEASGLELLVDGTNNGNGAALDREGRLIVCEHATRRVVRIEHDGSTTVIADRYRGMRLNRPNDVVVHSSGAIYFTDPISFGVETEVDLAGIYRVSPDTQRINLLVRDFVFPNGLAFSRDERDLYVNDSRRMHIRRIELSNRWNDGLLDLSTDQVFYDMRPASGVASGAPDGMKVDERGNVWCTGPGGIWVIDESGRHLGSLVLPDEAHATNFCFGGPDRRWLYVTTFTGVGRIRVNVAGSTRPGVGA